MKRLIIAMLLTAAAAFPSVSLVPLGSWAPCRAGILDSNFCVDGSSEKSLLLIRGNQAAATGYVYEVEGKTREGQTVKVSGYVARIDTPDGVATSVMIPMGAVYDVKITVTEVVAVGSQTN